MGTSETVYLYIANTPAEHRRGATGRLLPWAEARLVDDQGRAVEDPDTPGTAWLRMASVCDRYWNRQEHSRRTFEGFWYCTGDVFTRDAEGWWYHQGRGDDMLKISGQWVSPMEIENAVLQVDGVRDAAVVGVANADGLVRAVLFVVAGGGEGERGVGDRIRAQLQGRLSIYKCPRTIHLVEEIPRTATGKVQRFKLRRIAEAAGRG